MNPSTSLSRRRWIAGAFGIACFSTRGFFADYLMPSPALTEGPFYPDKMPLDQDNDLILIQDSITPAVGEITHLTGRVLSSSGEPIRNATVEIWQCDANAVYLHTADSGRKQSQQDKHFQGFGRFETASTGEYRFRTIKPVPYPGRPAGHIHAKVKVGGREVLTTQIFVAGAEGNARDGVYRSAGDLIDRELVTTDFTPIADSKIGELTASFDFVIGRTPNDRDFPSNRRGSR
ncbi:dioxygenase family protein [Blastopirellula marina]|uniref:Probable protocatechuate 3,4-dioxygenase, beta subunit n=1 Tax=Blastopirellula marina DSM 3645 TaxID=314230 RepID=A3ZXX0_9BACT|nr:protocatechuate 3,4-dioxygenase [Blastopirellula marina]EAQ78679.1 probable protocatechuate 3,4-dioxygenase, beta subunit [Blastopirellula marina DSM 3645]